MYIKKEIIRIDIVISDLADIIKKVNSSFISLNAISIDMLSLQLGSELTSEMIRSIYESIENEYFGADITKNIITNGRAKYYIRFYSKQDNVYINDFK